MKRKETTLINTVWSDLYERLNSIDWTNYGQHLLDMTTDESKRHDRGRPTGVRRGISVDTEAKYFAVKRVIEYISGASAPDVSDFFMYQKSCFAAYCIAKNPRFRDAITAWLGKHNDDAREVAALDYLELI